MAAHRALREVKIELSGRRGDDPLLTMMRIIEENIEAYDAAMAEYNAIDDSVTDICLNSEGFIYSMSKYILAGEYKKARGVYSMWAEYYPEEVADGMGEVNERVGAEMFSAYCQFIRSKS